MMRKEIVFALSLGACLGAAVAFAQDNPGAAAAPAATPDASAAPSSAATSGEDVIHLHMPVRHHVVHAPAKPAGPAVTEENPTVDSIGADATASPVITAPVSTAEPPAPRAAPPVKTAKSAHPAAQQSAPAIPFSFGEDGGTAPPEGSGSQDNPSPQANASAHETKTASLPPKPALPKGAPAASGKEPVHAKDEHAGLTKRGAVLFDRGMSNPSPQQFGGLKLLAGDVSTALESGASRVQLEAYGGAAGDKSSDSRRLSLKRALAVRQLLIDNGIPSNRIDVRAMGGTEDKGPNDRVDVYVRAS